jgi:hypothetical protein
MKAQREEDKAQREEDKAQREKDRRRLEKIEETLTLTVHGGSATGGSRERGRQQPFTPASSIPDPSRPRFNDHAAARGGERMSIGSGAKRALFSAGAEYREEIPVTPTSAAAEINPRSDSTSNINGHLRGLKLPTPTPFSGLDSKERAGSRNWLDRAINWMRLTVADETEDTQIGVFGTLLDKDAYAWFTVEKQRAEASGTASTLQYLFDKFLDMYAGGQSLMLLQTEFYNLEYKKGRCRDLASTQTEFDQYIYLLGIQKDDKQLGFLYGEVIKRGDLELWAEAARTRPKGLEEWKAAVQTSFTIDSNEKAARKTAAAASSRRASSFYSNTSHQQSVRANRVQVEGGEEPGRDSEGDTWERVEGQQEAKAAAQAAVVSGPRRRGVNLTSDQMNGLRKAGRCFTCYKKQEKMDDGRYHTSRNCPTSNRDLPHRPPSAEELNC